LPADGSITPTADTEPLMLKNRIELSMPVSLAKNLDPQMIIMIMVWILSAVQFLHLIENVDYQLTKRAMISFITLAGTLHDFHF